MDSLSGGSLPAISGDRCCFELVFAIIQIRSCHDTHLHAVCRGFWLRQSLLLLSTYGHFCVSEWMEQFFSPSSWQRSRNFSSAWWCSWQQTGETSPSFPLLFLFSRDDLDFHFVCVWKRRRRRGLDISLSLSTCNHLSFKPLSPPPEENCTHMDEGVKTPYRASKFNTTIFIIQ